MKVDVLAVLDEAISTMYRDSYSAIPDDLTKARDAVAEMIDIHRRLVAWDRNVNGGGTELGRICDEAAALIARLGVSPSKNPGESNDN